MEKHKKIHKRKVDFYDVTLEKKLVKYIIEKNKKIYPNLTIDPYNNYFYLILFNDMDENSYTNLKFEDAVDIFGKEHVNNENFVDTNSGDYFIWTIDWKEGRKQYRSGYKQAILIRFNAPDEILEIANEILEKNFVKKNPDKLKKYSGWWKMYEAVSDKNVLYETETWEGKITVEANNLEEAKEKAEKEIIHNLKTKYFFKGKIKSFDLTDLKEEK